MVKIFISYRRAESQEQTKRIASVLKRHFGDAQVVLDTDNFPLGNDFRVEIMQHLVESQVVLVVIGITWLDILLGRLADTSTSEPDWVMEEIETSIREQKRIIPVTLDEASFPPVKLLPPSIRSLNYRNGANLRTSIYRFDEDIRRLIQKIERDQGIFVEPKPNTGEYLDFLLLNSQWRYTTQDGTDSYICEQDNAYRIVVDVHSEEREDDYTSEWADNFYGQHRTYPVYVTYNGQMIEKTPFVGISNEKYLVPMPKIDETDEELIYFWDVHSIELKLARHISDHRLKWQRHKTLEDFAAHGNIELRE